MQQSPPAHEPIVFSVDIWTALLASKWKGEYRRTWLPARRRDAGGRQLIVASRRFLVRNAARSTPLAIRPDNPHVKFVGL